MVGLGWRAGGMAEYSTISERNMFPLADNMPLEEGALIEPVACTWPAISRVNFQKGWSALVIGAGMYLEAPVTLLLYSRPGA